MDSKRFILAMAALTAVFCAAMILYNFRTQPPYGQAVLTVSAASAAGVSGTLPDVSSAAGTGSTAESGASVRSAAGTAVSNATASVRSPSRAASSRASSSHTASTAASFPININTATAAELTALPGVGDVIAGRIVDYRTANGPFANVDELDKVKGIGSATLEKIRPYATV